MSNQQTQEVTQQTNALAGWSHLTRTAAHVMPDRYWRTGNIRKQLKRLRLTAR